MNPPAGNARAPLPCRAGIVAGILFFVAFLATSWGQNATNTNSVVPFQNISRGEPPLSPTLFNPDPGVPPVRTNLFLEPDTPLMLNRTTNLAVPLPPAVFNPDPGASLKSRTINLPFFTNEVGALPVYDGQAVPPGFALPRTNVVGSELTPLQITNPPAYGSEPLVKGLELPREGAKQNQIIEFKYENPDYPLSRQGKGYPPESVPEPDRWRIGFAPWRRYTSGDTETPYETPVTMLWHPYKQSLLKGDAPVIGQDIFLNLTAGMDTELEFRRVPVASGISASRPGSAEFYGESEQFSINNNLSFSLDLFKGETVFQPVHWALHLRPVYNVNYVYAKETGVVSPDPRGLNPGNNNPPPNNSGVQNPGDLDGLLNGQITPGLASLSGSRATTRLRDYFALQEAFVEFHLGDLSENYDFIATRLGNQAFNQDFRGFLFNDINLGARLFGNADDNRWQYNVMALSMREKDTYSELNTFDSRDQTIFLANAYRQDLLWKGYTGQLSFLANLDDGGTHYDRNGNITRPAPIGTIVPHDVHAYYFGWAGDGHIGRFNISHQFYQAVGHDELNGLAGRPVDINAQMAALELSYDRDWVRYKGSVFYASGDGNTTDGKATGFDTVLDNPNFTGGPFSYWARQGFSLGGTAVNLKQRHSLVPDLRTSKTEGQANFVNPGVLIFGLGTEMDLTPRLRSFFNVNYIRFVDTDSIQTALMTDKVDREVGWDLSLGFQYRPFLTDNVIVSTGFGALIPGRGFKDIYQTSTIPVNGFVANNNLGHVDDFLYSAVLAVTFTY